MTSASNETAASTAATVLQMLTGKWISQAISTAAKLNLADYLEDGPKSIEQLADLSKNNKRALLSLMRALASVGLFAERSDSTFENTALSDLLRTKASISVRALALFVGEHPTWAAWGALAHTVRTGESAFKYVHGQLPYEYFAKQGDSGRYFHDAFSNFSAQETHAVSQAFSFEHVNTLVDVGGGQGVTLCSLLRRNPSQRGILFDQPHVVETAKSSIASFEVGSRCTVLAGDFFSEVPAGADGYILKHVLFNWSDERARVILDNIRRAMSSDGTLFVIDLVIRPEGEQTFAKFMDLAQIVLYDRGRVRTVKEFTELLSASRFRVNRIVDTAAPSSVIEAVPV